MECLFAGGAAGVIGGESVTAGTALAFMPYRSPPQLRLSEAVAGTGAAEVEVRGPGALRGGP